MSTKPRLYRETSIYEFRHTPTDREWLSLLESRRRLGKELASAVRWNLLVSVVAVVSTALWLGQVL